MKSAFRLCSAASCVLGFEDGRLGGTKGDDPNRCSGHFMQYGGRDIFPGGIVFLLEPIHHAFPDSGIFGVARLFIVAGAAGEIGAGRMLCCPARSGRGCRRHPYRDSGPNFP